MAEPGVGGGSPPRPAPRSAAMDVALLWLLGVLATPLAGTVGGLVIWGALRAGGIGTETEVGFALAVLGGIFGSIVAAPVTLLVLPVGGLLICRFDVDARWAWLLPVLGAVAGSLRTLGDLGGFGEFVAEPQTAALADTWLFAGAVAGLVAGLPFALLVRLRRQ